MDIANVSLEQVLAARERRVEIQNKMMAAAANGVYDAFNDGASVDGSSYCVVCLTLNIAGEVKRTPMTRMLFDRGAAEFERLNLKVLDHLIIDDVTGSEAFWLLDEDGSRVKKLLERIEDGISPDYGENRLPYPCGGNMRPSCDGASEPGISGGGNTHHGSGGASEPDISCGGNMRPGCDGASEPGISGGGNTHHGSGGASEPDISCGGNTRPGCGGASYAGFPLDTGACERDSNSGRSAAQAARLFDFDVLVPAEVPEDEREFLSGSCFKTEPGLSSGSCFKAADGTLMKAQKLSRAGSRRCLICGRPAAECARSRAHGLDAIKAATQTLLRIFCADALAEAAYEALLSELYTTPKPGLVDLNNNGAHRDMDVPLFEKSAAALIPYFRDAALLGMDHCNMAKLRSRGLAAEKEMFAATDGVNTHKGMIYSMGLLLAGMGKALAGSAGESAGKSPTDAAIGNSHDNSYDNLPDNSMRNFGVSTDQASAQAKADFYSLDSYTPDLYAAAVRYAAELAQEDAGHMLADAETNPRTNGAAVLRRYGASGATGHAAAGFPDAVYCAERLMFYACNSAAVFALCDSMARLEDTNILHRGGREGLKYVREQAAAVCRMSVSERLPALKQLDDEMIRRNLSPGGSADMLALAFLLARWRELCRSL